MRRKPGLPASTRDKLNPRTNLTWEIADEIRQLYKVEGLTYQKIRDFIEEKYKIPISKSTVRSVIVNEIFIIKAKTVERADGHRNEYAKRLHDEEDDIIGKPKDIKDIGYGLKF